MAALKFLYTHTLNRPEEVVRVPWPRTPKPLPDILSGTEVLPTHYFHLVFTLPAELRPVALCNRKALFYMLFAAASETLLELGRDPKHLGGLLAASNVNTKLARARELLDAERPASPSEGEDELVGTWLDQMLALTGEDLSVCPRCGIGRMIRSRIRPGTTFAEHPEGSDTS